MEITELRANYLQSSVLRRRTSLMVVYFFRLLQPLKCTTECLFEIEAQGLDTFPSILVRRGYSSCQCV
jgi:hypothetical protein